MNFKQGVFVFLACVVSYTLFFFKSSAYPFNSMDSYFFLNFVHGITSSIPATPPLSMWLFSILPSNILILKLITFAVFFITMLIFCKTAENYSKKLWWLCLVLFLSSIMFMQVFYTLEDDLFAFPFIALSFYFISKHHQHPNTKWIIFSILALAVACGFWKFSIYFVFLFLFWTRFNKYYIILSILLLPFITYWINSFIPSFAVIENTPGIALYGLFTGCMFLLFFKKINKDVRVFMPTIWFATIIMILNTKFLFLAVPVFILVFIQTYEKLSIPLKLIVVLSIVALFIAGLLTNLSSIPNKHTSELFEVAQANAIGNEINCSWDFGYFYQWYFKKEYKVYGHVQPTIKKGIVITNKYEKLNECTKLYTNKQGKIWNCE